MRVATNLLSAAALILLAFPARSQSFDAHMAMGDSLNLALSHDQALQHFRAALGIENESYEALWKLALAHIDVARQLTDEHITDSLYTLAREYAQRAVEVDSTDAEGHFVLAYALGKVSLTKGGKERVRYGREIYNEAARAIELDPNHAGAHHILGAWHAEIKRLSGFTRFFAKTFLGGGFMSMASWDSSLTHLAMSVGLEPDHIFHRLELAQVQAEVGHYDRARGQLNSLLDMPIADVEDPVHKEAAADLLARIRDKS